MNRITICSIIIYACLAGHAIAQQAKGVLLEPEDIYLQIPATSPPIRMGRSTSYYDLSEKFPIPGHQGNQPSCVGWAVGYALKSFQEKHELGTSIKFSPSFIYNQTQLPGGGARFMDAFNILIQQGAVEMDTFPYLPNDASKQPSSEIKRRAAPYRISKAVRVEQHKSVPIIKGFLLENLPVVFSASCGKGFTNHKGSEVFNLQGMDSNEELHAMIAIGFDDERKAFRIQNSWGANWGDEGRAWIGYETYSRMVHQAFVAFDQPTEHVPPQTNDPSLSGFTIAFFAYPEQQNAVEKIRNQFAAKYPNAETKTRVKDDSFFTTATFPPKGSEIRFEPGIEDEQASNIWRILNQVYPSLRFCIVPVVNPSPTTNYISVMFSKDTVF